MTCAEFKDLVSALALGSLDAGERAACEAHLARGGPHEGCAEELRRATEATALLAASLPPVRPSPELWDRIHAEIHGDGAESREPGAAHELAGRPVTRPARARGVRGAPSTTRRPVWREAAAWTLAAAAAILAFVTGVDRRQVERRLGEAERELARVDDVDLQKQACLNELAGARIALRQKAQAISLLEDPGTRLIQLAAQGGAGYRASAIVNPGLQNAILVASAMPEQPGKDYQLWVIRGQQKISAGLLHTRDGDTTIAAVPREALAGGAPDAFAVTLEPEGGVPQPTGPIVLVGALPST